RRLDGKFEGVDSYQDRPGLEWIRLSSSSHQSVLSVFLWLGLPFGLLFLGLLCWWIRFCFPSFSKGERLALGSALLMSQVYDLMSFGVFSLPVVFVIARGASERLSPSDTSTSRRWLPLVGLVIWAGYWVGVTHHSVQRQEANTIDEFRQLVDSPFVSGEDYHRFARWMLSSARGFVEKEDFQHILSEAHRRTPDPSTLYHRAMAAKNEGERDSAKNWLIKGIETLPTFAPYYYGLALLAQTSQEEERRYLQALQVDNSHYQAWKNLGILLFERGDFQRSAYAFKQGKKAFLKKKGMNLDSTDRFYLNQLEEGLNKAGKMRDQEQKSK
ncbi:hypothetical protein HOF92_07230, partial [bacterium]|nr:hypothetical protein [bacterium]